MQLRSVTQLLNKHGIQLTTNEGKLVIKNAKGEIPYEIKRLLREREHDLIAWLKQRDPIIHDIIPIKPIPRTQQLPVSSAQKTYWRASQKANPTHTYNRQIALRLNGFVDPVLLNNSLNTLVKRYEILRTVYQLNISGELVQHIRASLAIITPIFPLSIADKNQQQIEQTIDKIALKQGQTDFNFANGPLFQTGLLQLFDTLPASANAGAYHSPISELKVQQSIFLYSFHLSILDEYSSILLIDELMSIYSTQASQCQTLLTKPVIEYADYVHWEYQWLKNEAFDRCQRYWEGQLSHGHSALTLPYNRKKTAMTTFRGERESWKIADTTTRKLFTVGRRESVSIYTLLLTTLQLLLMYRTGSPDIHIGTTVNNRPDTHLQPMIGPLAGITVVHCELSGDPVFNNLLHKTHLLATEAMCLQPIAYSNLVDIARAHGYPKHTPLCQVTLDLTINKTKSSQCTAITGLIEKRFLNTCAFEMSMTAEMTGNCLQGTLTYQSDLFDKKTIKHFLQQYQHLLSVVTTYPNQPISKLLSTL